MFPAADPEREGTGWTFSPNTRDACVDAISSALRVYREQPDVWRAIQLRGMQRDAGWSRAAAQYEKVIASSRTQDAEPSGELAPA